MIAKVYELSVYDSTMDMIHGMSHAIVELYVPELDICINGAHCFQLKGNKSRYSDAKLLRDVELNDLCVKWLEAAKEGIIARDLFIETDPFGLWPKKEE